METTLLTTKEAASILRCSQRLVYQLIEEKSIPFVKIGRRYLIPADELNRWIHESCEIRNDGKNE